MGAVRLVTDVDVAPPARRSAPQGKSGWAQRGCTSDSSAGTRAAGYSFYVYEANAPLFRRFAEDYVIAPDGDGTRYTWTVAIEPKSALRLPFMAFAPVMKAAFGKLASDGQKYFAAR